MDATENVAATENEQPLTGGNSTAVVRVGDTVRRTAGPWTPTVHALLQHLRARGVTEVPEPHGTDDAGREVVSFVPGDVAHYPLPTWLWTDAVLHDAATLLRRVHDASVGLDLPDAVWQVPAREPVEVVCHNDFAPYNLVFDDGRLVGVIDCDTASPGPRVWDLAYLAYRLVPYGEDAGDAAPGPGERAARLEELVRTYSVGLDHAPTPDEVLATMVDRLEDLARFSDARATETGRTDLAEHAAMYRRDAQRVRALASSPT